MVKFSTFEPAIAAPNDELLLVQGGTPKRMAITALGARIAKGTTPPEDGRQLWLQTDDNDGAIESWFLHKSGNWLSQAVYSVETYRSRVTGSTTRQEPSPYLGSKFWIESMAAKCIPYRDFAAGEWVDFQLRLINESRQQSVEWYLRLESAVRFQAFQKREAVGLVVNAADALAIWFRVQRTGGTAEIRFVSMSVILRKVYDNASS